MAKVSIKSEKITPFGGFFYVRELFSRYVGPVIDKVLGLRCMSYGYQYSEIFMSRTGRKHSGTGIYHVMLRGHKKTGFSLVICSLICTFAKILERKGVNFFFQNT